MTESKHSEDDNTRNGFVSSYLLYLLAAASDAASSQFHQQVRDSGLRVPEWRVMACLFDQDGEMITRLAEFSLIEQSRLTRIIDQMDKRGLVERKLDIADKRRVRVHLTKEGKTLAKKLVADAKTHEENLLASLQQENGGDIKEDLKLLLSCINKG